QVAQVSISPNPFNQHFEVSFHATDNSIVHLKLMDMQGATIFNKSLEAEKGTNTFVYNDHRLQSGIYLLSIVQKGVPAKTFRMVKPLNENCLKTHLLAHCHERLIPYRLDHDFSLLHHTLLCFMHLCRRNCFLSF